MDICVHCGIEITGAPVIVGGQNYCTRRCADRSTDINRLTEEIKKTHSLTIEALVSSLDAREKETGKHSHRVARYTLLMAERLGLSKEDALICYHGGLLHDIGKIGVPDHILLKPGKLTEDEWIEMRRHPVIGHKILKNIDYFAKAGEIVLTHEERYDGSGYPKGLIGDEIPLGSRLFAISDTIDAITFDRPYRKAKPFEKAIDEIRRYSGSQFDPYAISVFERCADELEELIDIYQKEIIKEKNKKELPYDPVCTMEITNDSQFYLSYNGSTFYFCSANCQDMFRKNPAKYIEEHYR